MSKNLISKNNEIGEHFVCDVDLNKLLKHDCIATK